MWIGLPRRLRGFAAQRLFSSEPIFRVTTMLATALKPVLVREPRDLFG
jgi:hypothetical protein